MAILEKPKFNREAHKKGRRPGQSEFLSKLYAPLIFPGQKGRWQVMAFTNQTINKI